MSAIGSASLELSADPAKLVAGLQSAEQAITQFANRGTAGIQDLQKQLASASTSGNLFQGLIQGVGQKLGQAITDTIGLAGAGLGAGAGQMAGALGQIVTGAVGGAVKLVTSTAGALVSTVGGLVKGTISILTGSFVSGFGSIFSGLLSGVTGLISGIGSAVSSLFSGIMDGVKGLVTGGMTFVTSAISIVWRNVSETFDNIREVSQHAQTLGTSADFLQSLSMSGVETNTLNRGLERFSRVIADARSGTVQAQVHLQSLGITMRDLHDGMNLEGAFGRLAEQMSRMTNAQDRLQALHNIFGQRISAAMAPALARGAEGLREYREMVERMGLSVEESVGETLGEKVRQMGRSWTQVGMAVRGLWTQIAVGLAPAIRDIGTTWRDTISSFVPMARTVGTVLATVAEVASAAFRELLSWVRRTVGGFEGWSSSAQTVKVNVINSLENITLGAIQIFDALRWSAVVTWNAMKEGAGFVLQGVDRLIRGYEDLRVAIAQVMPGQRVWEVRGDVAAARNARREWINAIREPAALPGGTDISNITAFFQRLRNAAMVQQYAPKDWGSGELDRLNRQMMLTPTLQSNILTMTMNLRNQITQLSQGWDNQYAELNRWAQAAGNMNKVGRRMFEGARDALFELQALQETQKFSPADTMERELKRIDRLYAQGRISAEIYSMSVQQSMSRAMSSLHLGQFLATPTMLAGSAAAASTILQNRFQFSSDPQQQMLRIAEAQRQIQAQQLQVMQEILRQRQDDFRLQQAAQNLPIIGGMLRVESF